MGFNPIYKRSLQQQSPNFLAPKTSLVEDSFSTEDGGRRGDTSRMIVIRTAKPPSLPRTQFTGGFSLL